MILDISQSLHNIYLELLIIPAMAMLFRLRGGLWGDTFKRIFGVLWGSTTNRVIFWGICPGLIIGWLLNSWQAGVITAVLFYIDSVIGWYDSLGMGFNNDGTSTLRDIIVLTLRGLMWAAPVGVVCWWWGVTWWPMIPAGLSCAPMYYIFNHVLNYLSKGDLNYIYSAEFFFGMMLGLGMWTCMALS